MSSELNKKSENDAIVSDIENLPALSDEYAKECEMILDTMSENGASASKFRVLLGKLSNWHSARWQKLWYKIVFILLCAIVAFLLVIGTLCGIDGVMKNKQFANSFTEWSIYNNSETKQFSSSSKRFALSDSELRRIQLNVLSDEETQNYINSAAEKSKEQPGKYMPLSDELSTWLKENLFGSVPDSGVTNISITIKDYSGVVNKRTGKRKTTQTLKGVLALTVAEDGSITSITDLTNAGFYKTSY